MFGWIPAVLLLFWWLPPRRAVITAFVIAWLFLPMQVYQLPGPDYTKASATCGGVLLAAIVFDSRRMLNLSFCPSPMDIPMLVFCLSPILSAITNAPELSLYDGMSASLEQIVTWGLPYLIGRIYLGHLPGLRELTIGVFLGGLVYVPLCLIEMRFSPQLHRWVYGFHQHDFGQTIRDDGYRPMVFMEHGLAVAMFMTTASLAGIWLWKTGAYRKVIGQPIGLLLFPLVGTTILLKSAAGIVFLATGIGVLFASRVLRSPLFVAMLMLIPSLYVTARVGLEWDMPTVMTTVRDTFGPARAQSLEFRVQNDRMIVDRAESKPLFGWGLFGRAFVKDPEGNIVSVPDSLWVITLGQAGRVGLAALLLLMLPVAVVIWRLPRYAWRHPAFAGVIVFGLQLPLYALDNLLNNMPNPIFLLGLGGLTTLAWPRRHREPHAVPMDLPQLETA
jgi:hypothetical protein